jgi:hypothetical protein
MRLIQIVVVFIFVILPIVLVANLFLNDDTSTISILELEETETTTLNAYTKTSLQTSTQTMSYTKTEDVSRSSVSTSKTKSDLTFTTTTTHIMLEKSEKIIIILPFDPENPPDGLQPMGETINHEVKYGGHPGIDYQWGDVDPSPKIYSVAKGVIVEIINTDLGWTITTGHSGFDKEYFVRYAHLGSYDTSLKVGTEVDTHTFIGYAMHPNVPDPNMHMIHWEFGKMDEWGRYDDRLCPMTYFDEDSRILIEEIWENSPYSHKVQFPKICSGFYDGKDE